MHFCICSPAAPRHQPDMVAPSCTKYTTKKQAHITPFTASSAKPWVATPAPHAATPPQATTPLPISCSYCTKLSQWCEEPARCYQSPWQQTIGAWSQFSASSLLPKKSAGHHFRNTLKQGGKKHAVFISTYLGTAESFGCSFQVWMRIRPDVNMKV